jgi:hypothetical protein
MPSNQRESFSNESARVQQAIGPFAEGPGNRTAEGRAADNRPSGNSAAAGNRNGLPPLNSQRQQGFQSSEQPQAQARPAETGGGWQRFSAGQRPRIEMQGNPRSGGSDNQAPPRANDREQQPSNPSTLPRLNSQRVAPSNSSGQENAPPASADRPGGWQRFSGPSSGGSAFRGQNQGNDGPPAPRTSPPPNNRPQLELNRPILRPRPFGESDRGAQRDSAPNNFQRGAPVPRSAPESSVPGNSNRMAPQSNPRPESSPRGGFGGNGGAERGPGSRARGAGRQK